MTTPREEMAALIADVVSEHFERLRANVLQELLRMRAPNWALTPKGELYVDGVVIGNVALVFKATVVPVVEQQLVPVFKRLHELEQRDREREGDE
jgi:hypothetical protein